MIFLVEPSNDNSNLGCDFDCALGGCGTYHDYCDKACSGNDVCTHGCDYDPPSCTCNSHAYCYFAID